MIWSKNLVKSLRNAGNSLVKGCYTDFRERDKLNCSPKVTKEVNIKVEIRIWDFLKLYGPFR